MNGGKKYGEGHYGITYDFSCKLEDNQTFCNLFKTKKAISIQLHSFDKMLELANPKEIVRFVKYMHHLDHHVAKVFKNVFVNDQNSFQEELKNMKIVYNIFGDLTEKYTTLTSMRLFGFNFVAAFVIFEDNSHYYVTFSKKCDEDLFHAKLTESRFKRLTKDLLSALEVMQTKNFMHYDLKPDNIIYCKRDNKYKFIDWGLSRFKISGNIFHGTPMFTAPYLRYLQGVPPAIAIRMMYYMTWVRMTDWFNSAIFQELYKIIYDDFEKIIKTNYKNNKKLDLFSLGMTFGYLIYKNKLSWKKHKDFVIKLVSMYGYQKAEHVIL